MNGSSPRAGLPAIGFLSDTNPTHRGCLASSGKFVRPGDGGIFSPSAASVAVMARGEGLIWRISSEELEAYLDADPVAGIELSKGLLRLSGQRLRAMNGSLPVSGEMSAVHDFWKHGV